MIALAAAISLAGSLFCGEGDSLISKLFERLSPAVVQVLGPGGIRGIPSRASGIVVSPEGHILTFYSAVFLEGKVYVALADGREVPAGVVGQDPGLGVAVLKIDPPHGRKLPWIGLSSINNNPAPGVPVIMIGYPFKISGPGEKPSVFFGIVKSRLRLDLRLRLRRYTLNTEVLLTDVPSNPGAQGGGLFDMHGSLIGLVGRQVEAPETNTFISYSVPVDCFRRFVLNTIKGIKSPPKTQTTSEKPGPVYLGIRLLDFGFRSSPPAYIERVEKGSPAEKAGLKPDDLVLEIAGKPVRTCNEFYNVMKTLVPGKRENMVIKRKNKRVEDALVVMRLPVFKAWRLGDDSIEVKSNGVEIGERIEVER